MRELVERSVRPWVAVSASPGSLRPFLAALLPLVAAHAALLAVFDLAARPGTTLALFCMAMAALAWASRRLEAIPVPKAVLILGLAALLRLLLLPLPPTLSDDVLRYVWDGRVVAAGLDPYRLAPQAAELESLRDDLWERLPHRHVPTVYPPVAMAAFSIAARLPLSVHALKLMLAVADLASCGLLIRIARNLSIPEERVIWYAWNPLATLEVSGMGHVDGLGVLAVAAAVAMVTGRPRRVVVGALAAAAGVLVKLVPAAGLPVWARCSGRPRVFLTVALALSAAGLAPVVLGGGGGLPPGLVTYGVSWEFNGPLWEPLARLFDRVDLRDGVEATLDRLKQWVGLHEFWNRFYPYNYPQLLAKLALLPGLAAGLLLAWRRAHPLASTGVAFASLLLFSATVYPWYLLWILPWAALTLQPAWLLLALTLPFSYLPQLTGVELVPWIYLLVWAPFFLLLVIAPRWSTD